MSTEYNLTQITTLRTARKSDWKIFRKCESISHGMTTAVTMIHTYNYDVQDLELGFHYVTAMSCFTVHCVVNFWKNLYKEETIVLIAFVSSPNLGWVCRMICLPGKRLPHNLWCLLKHTRSRPTGLNIIMRLFCWDKQGPHGFRLWMTNRWVCK